MSYELREGPWANELNLIQYLEEPFILWFFLPSPNNVQRLCCQWVNRMGEREREYRNDITFETKLCKTGYTLFEECILESEIGRIRG